MAKKKTTKKVKKVTVDEFVVKEVVDPLLDITQPIAELQTSLIAISKRIDRIVLAINKSRSVKGL